MYTQSASFSSSVDVGDSGEPQSVTGAAISVHTVAAATSSCMNWQFSSNLHVPLALFRHGTVFLRAASSFEIAFALAFGFGLAFGWALAFGDTCAPSCGTACEYLQSAPLVHLPFWKSKHGSSLAGVVVSASFFLPNGRQRRGRAVRGCLLSVAEFGIAVALISLPVH